MAVELGSGNTIHHAIWDRTTSQPIVSYVDHITIALSPLFISRTEEHKKENYFPWKIV